VQSKFQNLRSIFQEILLEKVKQFDEELSKLAEKYSSSMNDLPKEDPATTSRTSPKGNPARTAPSFERNRSLAKTNSVHLIKDIERDIEKKGFTNVLIRDHSVFSLKKWNKAEEREYQEKKKELRVRYSKNCKQTAIIYQFVKQYTTTVKARDNIYQKWENREKNGITPEELKYLCSTSLFLNHTLNKSEK
jgi:hypothetical protein